jgi:peptidoglycan/LPS O-acetylase OafA/YrhL
VALIKATSRLPQLDILRLVAIVLVLSHHMTYVALLPGRLAPFADFLVLFGWTGVDLFFVLSGFLIGGLLFNEIRKSGHLNTYRFLLRRALKIWPLYYGFLILCTVLISVRTGAGLLDVIHSLRFCYLNVQNFDFDNLMRISHQSVFIAHVWTLAVEEHFYLGLPLLLLMLLRINASAQTCLKFLPSFCAFMMVACPLARICMRHLSANYLYQTPLRVDGLFAGVLLAYIWHYHHQTLLPLLKRPSLLFLGGSFCLLPMTVVDHERLFTHTVGYSLLYTGYGLILLAMMSSTEYDGAMRRLFDTGFARGLAFLGSFSYPIYLVHMLCFNLVDWFLKSHLINVSETLRWLIGWLACLGLSVGTGIAVGLLLEKPILALRNQILPAEKVSRA